MRKDQADERLRERLDGWCVGFGKIIHALMISREQKMTLGAMRASGVRGLLIYCSDYKCSHRTRLGAEYCDRFAMSEEITRVIFSLVLTASIVVGTYYTISHFLVAR